MLMNEKYMLRCFLEPMSYLGLSKHNYEIKERYLMACPLNEQIPRGPRTFIGEKVRKREVRSIFKKKKTDPTVEVERKREREVRRPITDLTSSDTSDGGEPVSC